MEHDHGTIEIGERSSENGVNLTVRVDPRQRRTVRKQESWPNSEKTAQQSNGESATLWQPSLPTGGRATTPHGSALVFTTASVLPGRTAIARPPDGRHSTETATTEIENGETVIPTARKRKEPSTAWELPRLIRPQPLRLRHSELKTAIQPFYVQLAAYIFSSRYATASQVLRRFPEVLSTERTAQRHLQNMANHGLIAVASTRGTSPNFPFAYFVTRKGVKLLKAHLPNGSRVQIPATEERRSRGQSLHSVLHELCVTEFALMLATTAHDRGDITLLSQERRYFRGDRRLTYVDEGTTKRIEPDFGFLAAITNEAGEQSLLPQHFVEVELGTHRIAAIKEKLAAYDRWGATSSSDFLRASHLRFGVQKNNPNFRLLLIACDAYGGVGDDHRLLDLLIESSQLPPKMRDRTWLCKAMDLNAQARQQAPLNASIWLRAKDVKGWQPNYGNRRKFFMEQIPYLRSHTLFPYTTNHRKSPKTS